MYRYVQKIQLRLSKSAQRRRRQREKAVFYGKYARFLENKYAPGKKRIAFLWFNYEKFLNKGSFDLSSTLLTQFIDRHWPDKFICTALNSHDDPADVLITDVFDSRNEILRAPGKKKIFLTTENTDNKTRYKFNLFDDYMLGQVDLAIGFKRKITAQNYARLPFWMMTTGFYLCRDIDEVAKKCDAINSLPSTLSPKAKFCVLIASHDNMSPFKIRHKLYDVVSSVGFVSCPGKFKNNVPDKVPFGDDKKAEYLKDFKFNICPENSIGDGYVTEKLFDSLVSGTVPIYWSSPDPEPGIVNPECFLCFDMDNPQKLIDQIKKLDKDDALLKEFLERPRFLPTAPALIWEMIADTKEKLERVLFHQ
ncbi:MAG: glycosyltransferase family 10 [Alphaproteobacteria bacterium]|nr:glycosyltransferase family 10 [Alphaproteobacteria bacterium]